MALKQQEKGGIQVISRAMSIMRVVGLSRAEAQSGKGLSLGQLALRCDLPRSTVQRIVTALVKEGLLAQLNGQQGVTLGPEIQALAATLSDNIWKHVHPHLLALAQETGETVDLAVLKGNEVLFIDQVPGRHRLRAMSRPGEHFSALVTANGKACLSLLDDEQLLQELNIGNGLYEELLEVRAGGVAWDINGHTLGISAVGAGFIGFDGKIYAVSIPAPSLRFEKIKDELAAKLLQCLALIKR